MIKPEKIDHEDGHFMWVSHDPEAKTPPDVFIERGSYGAEGARTLDPQNAILVLSQAELLPRGCSHVARNRDAGKSLPE